MTGTKWALFKKASMAAQLVHSRTLPRPGKLPPLFPRHAAPLIITYLEAYAVAIQKNLPSTPWGI